MSVLVRKSYNDLAVPNLYHINGLGWAVQEEKLMPTRYASAYTPATVERKRQSVANGLLFEVGS